MQESWQNIIDQLAELELQLQDPNISSNPEKIKNIGIKISGLSPSANKIKEYVKIKKQIQDNKELENDSDKEFVKLAIEENQELIPQKNKLKKEIVEILNPKNPDDKKNAIIEIRAGTGGEEAALFADDLTGMIFRFAEKKCYQVEIFNKNSTENGGIKDISFAIKGNEAYGNLKYETGVHRVQRIPKTESKGRLHTSAASIFVCPEATEKDFNIAENDIKIDTFRASGAGGQHVNKTDSAVRITHLPSGIVVSCQDEKSQHKIRARAMSVLRSRLLESIKAKEENEQNKERQENIKRGDRSEKIRTWNWPQDRMTDHRINKSFFGIKKFLEGNLDEVIEAFRIAES